MAVLPQQVPPQAAAPPMPGAGPSPQPGGMPGIPGLNQMAAHGANGQTPAAGMTMMIFLAGLGFPEYVRAMDKIKNPGGKGHGAAGKEANANPQMTSPAAAQQLAQLAAFKQKQQMGAMAGGGPPPGAVPPPNPMAMFGR